MKSPLRLSSALPVLAATPLTCIACTDSGDADSGNSSFGDVGSAG